MQEILRLCVELDGVAERTYAAMEQHAADSALAAVFAKMRVEESQHVEWWSNLLDAWAAGLVPDIPRGQEVLEDLRNIEQDLAATVPSSFAGCSTDELLEIAARMEFFMLDPVFGLLADLMDPGSSIDARKAYSQHVNRLVEAIERFHSGSGLATFLARALKRAFKDQQQLAVLATHDQLTRLNNRRGLCSHLEHLLPWSQRYKRPLGVALLDLDNFKQLNDTHGHHAGDRALATIASDLRSIVRDSDIVGRWGGDEFMVIAPECSDQELRILLDRIVTAIRDTSIVADGVRVALTVSAGGAVLTDGQPVATDELIAAADRSLYSAKRNGRDQVGALITRIDPGAQTS